MSELFQKLQPHLDRYYAFSTAATLFSWDNETAAPKAAIENTSRAIGILSGELYGVLINDDVKQLLAELSTEAEQARLSFQEKAIVKNLSKQYRQLQAIPPQEYQEFAALTAQAFPVWEKGMKWTSMIPSP